MSPGELHRLLTLTRMYGNLIIDMDLKNIHENKAKYLALTPVTEECITAEEFMKLRKEKNNNIESVKIIPASISSGSYGGFLVKYKTPIFK